jgi:ketosteroid isomerase-like protein
VLSRDTARAVSEENVEIVRRVFETVLAVERDDLGADGHDNVADDYEWIVPTPLDGRSVWRGLEGLLEFTRIWLEQFDDWSMRVERWVDAGGERVVALTRQSGTGKGSGVPVEMNLGQVYELDHGRITRVTNYFSHAEALAAAGLRE